MIFWCLKDRISCVLFHVCCVRSDWTKKRKTFLLSGIVARTRYVQFPSGKNIFFILANCQRVTDYILNDVGKIMSSVVVISTDMQFGCNTVYLVEKLHCPRK